MSGYPAQKVTSQNITKSLIVHEKPVAGEPLTKKRESLLQPARQAEKSIQKTANASVAILSRQSVANGADLSSAQGDNSVMGNPVPTLSSHRPVPERTSCRRCAQLFNYTNGEHPLRVLEYYTV